MTVAYRLGLSLTCDYQAPHTLNMSWSSQQEQGSMFLQSTHNIPGREVIIMTTGSQCSAHQTQETSSILHPTHYLQSPRWEKCNCNLFLVAPLHATAVLFSIIRHVVILIYREISVCFGLFCFAFFLDFTGRKRIHYCLIGFLLWKLCTLHLLSFAHTHQCFPSEIVRDFSYT